MAATSLFPYDKIRPEQDELVNDVYAAVSSGKCLIAHAPTGLGKTAAALAPALEYALKSKKAVFFLTSRHTQHLMAVETAKLIKQRYKTGFSVTDIVGKKHMCARDDVSGLFSRQFYDYCHALTETDGCEFFLNFKKGSMLTSESKVVIARMAAEPMHSDEVVAASKRCKVCPYEAAVAASRDAALVIADYNYFFSPKVRDGFLRKTGKSLEDAIIIVDEAHNLPDRLREMLTDKVSTTIIERAIKEAEKASDLELTGFLLDLSAALNNLGRESGEQAITKGQLLEPLRDYDLAAMIERMSVVSETDRESGQQSFLGSVAKFLESWQDSDEGYARILYSGQGQKGKAVSVSYRCLDPSLASSGVIRQAHSVILMSGTLTPTAMYRDILGFPESTMLREYRNPMPKENRLALIVTAATTKFSKRNSSQYEKLADVCIKASSAIQGNVILFFPSYTVMGEVHKHIHGKIRKQVLKEHADLSKDEKQKLFQQFKDAHITGGVLLAVIGGSFSEGIDLPGKLLNGVVIVGLPLGQPDLETKELIRYYDARFKKGWDYGYVFPAFTKALQSAGRCIRTETDRGVVVFVDERYAWESYYRCFPKDMAPKTTEHYAEAIADFFRKG
ncbi:ATP-dependent DNA helicase [Candidatus Woesearchaeota archaeon]|nr:ATP-dependent DNA helicase [Candidatus Woesearchaeota archaeon]